MRLMYWVFCFAVFNFFSMSWAQSALAKQECLKMYSLEYFETNFLQQCKLGFDLGVKDVDFLQQKKSLTLKVLFNLMNREEYFDVKHSDSEYMMMGYFLYYLYIQDYRLDKGYNSVKYFTCEKYVQYNDLKVKKIEQKKYKSCMAGINFTAAVVKDGVDYLDFKEELIHHLAEKNQNDKNAFYDGAWQAYVLSCHRLGL